MQITKYETNVRRNMYHSSSNVSLKPHKEKTKSQVINVFSDVTYQKFLGFGGAFTESAAICYDKLTKEKQEDFIKDYFSQEGLGYNFGRLPIGSSDFSKKSYSYASKSNLSDFNIENDKLIIKLLEDAKNQNKDLVLLSSPWSPPKFMKSNKSLSKGGKLLPKYYELYAEYLVKYIKAYKDLGFNIKYMTVQNEPNSRQWWESCEYSAVEERTFVTDFLYPTFVKNDIKTKILIWDENKENLFNRSREILNSNEALNAIDGLAYHYYTGDHFESIRLTHEMFPKMLLIHTEGCCGFSKESTNNFLHNGEIYAHDILGDLNSGSNAYIDWNLLLDSNGGPNHKNNFCHAPIMLKESGLDYKKFASYYYIGHFSKFIKPNSIKIASTSYTDKIEVTAFKNSDNSISVVLLNRNSKNYEYNLVLDSQYELHDNLDAHAIVTYTIKKECD